MGTDGVGVVGALSVEGAGVTTEGEGVGGGGRLPDDGQNSSRAGVKFSCSNNVLNKREDIIHSTMCEREEEERCRTNNNSAAKREKQNRRTSQ